MNSSNSWQTVMSLDCTTESQSKISSYGDWGFTISRIALESLNEPLQSYVQKQIGFDHYFCYDHEKCDPQLHPVHVQYLDKQYDNAKDALPNITVEVNLTEETFKQKYGFWEIHDFIVYNRDGNGSTCSFETNTHAYVGHYVTS